MLGGIILLSVGGRFVLGVFARLRGGEVEVCLQKGVGEDSLDGVASDVVVQPTVAARFGDSGEVIGPEALEIASHRLPPAAHQTLLQVFGVLLAHNPAIALVVILACTVEGGLLQRALHPKQQCRLLDVPMHSISQELGALAPAMPVKDAKVEDLRIATLALRRLHLTLGRPATIPAADTHGLPLREGRNLDGARLVGVFIVRPAASTHAGAEVVLGALDRDAHDRRLPRGL